MVIYPAKRAVAAELGRGDRVEGGMIQRGQVCGVHRAHAVVGNCGGESRHVFAQLPRSSIPVGVDVGGAVESELAQPGVPAGRGRDFVPLALTAAIAQRPDQVEAQSAGAGSKRSFGAHFAIIVRAPVIVVPRGRATIRGFAERDAAVNGVRLHYRIGGDPREAPVLLQHGWAGTSYTWRRVAPLLADAGCAVLVPDLRGYGDSDKPTGHAGYDGRSLAEDGRALVRALDFGLRQPLVVAAHDMGAPGALIWAAMHPDEIAALLSIEEPVLLPRILQELIVYSEHAARTGSLWWWMQMLALNDHDARRWEPKRLRLFTIPATIARTGRRVRLHLAAKAPWADLLDTAVQRLRAVTAAPG